MSGRFIDNALQFKGCGQGKRGRDLGDYLTPNLVLTVCDRTLTN